MNPNALQFELSSGEFAVCSPLKIKAVKHKVCAVYFRIRNKPYRINSKSDSILLVALCESGHLKSNDRTFQVIAKSIVNDLRILESTGVGIPPEHYLNRL